MQKKHDDNNTQSTALSELERKQLENAEGLISQNLLTFTSAGSELATIRDNRLYREKHDNWGSYCKERWGFSKSYADRLIAAAKLASEKLTPIGAGFNCEGELRKLVPLTNEQFTRALEKAREKAKKKNLPLTATLIGAQVPKRRRKKNHDDEELHLPTDVSKQLETLASQVDAVINGKETEKSFDLLQQVQAFLKELSK